MTKKVEAEALLLTQELIRRQSVTPDDCGCQDLVAERLNKLGFHCEFLQIEEVRNLWAVYGTDGPLFVYLGHTDVVPAGPKEQWTRSPFGAEIEGGMLYGRGAADMKASIAAMIVALEQFFASQPRTQGRIGILLTSDEEGRALHGIRAVMEEFDRRGLHIDRCLVGEPSSTAQLGDVIKNGRRGSLSGALTIRGIQGHVAYPERARNPIHEMASFLAEFVAEEWDQGNEFFPATTLQISNITAGIGAKNVIPGRCEIDLNFRYGTAMTEAELKQRTEAMLEKHGLDYEIRWTLDGPPFVTSRGPVIDATVTAIREVVGIETKLSTAGGTSDGRFVAPRGAELIELGVVNKSIHKIDEHVKVADLDRLRRIYQRILEKLCTA